MEVLLVSATYKEIEPFLSHHSPDFTAGTTFKNFKLSGISISVLLTGVGGVQACFHLTKLLSTTYRPDLIIFTGIAGEFSKDFDLGQVYIVEKDQFSDLGALDKNGNFRDVYDLGLINENQFPFSHKILESPGVNEFDFLPKVSGLTANFVTSSKVELDSIIKRYPDSRLETMENAYFFYVSIQFNTKFISLRSTSNYVGERDKELWKLSLAIENLNRTLQEIIDNLIEILSSKVHSISPFQDRKERNL